MTKVSTTGTVYGAGCEMIDYEINREASEYMVDHYDELVRQVKKMGISEERAYDLVHDVYVSIVRAENDGEGYDMSKGKTGNIIAVHEFIYGRLKRYSLNEKYTLIGSYTDIPASTTSDDYDRLDNFQKAYATAGEYDEIESIEDSLSIAEEIEYCIGFENIIGLNMRALLKNLNILNDKNIDKSLFNNLRQATKIHDEFGEAFQHIINFAASNTAEFNRILVNI